MTDRPSPLADRLAGFSATTTAGSAVSACPYAPPPVAYCNLEYITLEVAALDTLRWKTSLLPDEPADGPRQFFVYEGDPSCSGSGPLPPPGYPVRSTETIQLVARSPKCTPRRVDITAAVHPVCGPVHDQLMIWDDDRNVVRHPPSTTLHLSRGVWDADDAWGRLPPFLRLLDALWRSFTDEPIRRIIAAESCGVPALMSGAAPARTLSVAVEVYPADKCTLAIDLQPSAAVTVKSTIDTRHRSSRHLSTEIEAGGMQEIPLLPFRIPNIERLEITQVDGEYRQSIDYAKLAKSMSGEGWAKTLKDVWAFVVDLLIDFKTVRYGGYCEVNCLMLGIQLELEWGNVEQQQRVFRAFTASGKLQIIEGSVEAGVGVRLQNVCDLSIGIKVQAAWTLGISVVKEEAESTTALELGSEAKVEPGVIAIAELGWVFRTEATISWPIKMVFKGALGLPDLELQWGLKARSEAMVVSFTATNTLWGKSSLNFELMKKNDDLFASSSPIGSDENDDVTPFPLVRVGQ